MPGWLALIEQTPAPLRVTVFSVTLHAVEAVEKTTGSPDDAVAVNVTLPEPWILLLYGPKVIVCGVRATMVTRSLVELPERWSPL